MHVLFCCFCGATSYRGKWRCVLETAILRRRKSLEAGSKTSNFIWKFTGNKWILPIKNHKTYGCFLSNFPSTLGVQRCLLRWKKVIQFIQGGQWIYVHWITFPCSNGAKKSFDKLWHILLLLNMSRKRQLWTTQEARLEHQTQVVKVLQRAIRREQQLSSLLFTETIDNDSIYIIYYNIVFFVVHIMRCDSPWFLCWCFTSVLLHFHALFSAEWISRISWEVRRFWIWRWSRVLWSVNLSLKRIFRKKRLNTLQQKSCFLM